MALSSFQRDIKKNKTNTNKVPVASKAVGGKRRVEGLRGSSEVDVG